MQLSRTTQQFLENRLTAVFGEDVHDGKSETISQWLVCAAALGGTGHHKDFTRVVLSIGNLFQELDTEIESMNIACAGHGEERLAAQTAKLALNDLEPYRTVVDRILARQKISI